MRRALAPLLVSLLIAGCGGADENGVGSSAAAEASRSPDGRETAMVEPTSEASSRTANTVRIRTSGGEHVRVEVEVADDAEEMVRGLMGRTALAEDAGMLFVYPEERELSFWMKDTLIPLSIAFMDAKGRIVDIQDMRALDETPPHYTSAEPARYALEVNKDFFDSRGVEVGDRALLPT